MVTGGSAWHVALRRASHQMLDMPPVFADPFAIPLLGPAGADALRRTPRGPGRVWSRSLRAVAVARSRFAEDQLAAAVAAGVRHYCLLGAGLDTFALRNPWPQLQVFEVDRPPMLALKRELMQHAGLTMPAWLTQISADLAALPPGLAGVAQGQPCFFAMLGVAPYLAPGALAGVLALVHTCGPGSGIAFDYRLPHALLSPQEQRQHDSLQSRVTAAGEPFRSFSTPAHMTTLLAGFARVEQHTPGALNTLYFSGRSDGLRILGDALRLAVAWV